MINIAEILKDCPKGTKLYSPLFGDCMFREIDNSSNFKIVVEIENGEPRTFDDFGRYFSGFQNSECMLFPSKDNRDWNTFRPFKDGDIISNNSYIAIFYKFGKPNFCAYDKVVYYHCWCYQNGKESKFEKDFGIGRDTDFRFATDKEKQKLFDTIKTNGYKWDSETKTLEKLIVPKFKVGDQIVRKNSISNSYIVSSVSSEYYGLVLPDRTGVGVLNVSEQDDWELVLPIHKFKVGDKIVKKDNPTECWYVQGVDTNCNSDYFYYIVAKGQLANLHFRDQDEWELVHNKFDISTLKAYDKVLVRDTNEQVWVADLFSHVLDRPLGGYTFACVGHYPNQCIPYLGNEHLLGKCDDCGEYYKNW